ncbi:twin-arginine translocase subunit TatC [Parvularcula sp. LCG005]|uniref:twin-arginine translocase subunit TatC n=1 Tax=Parvularcula sp. LCG005 TaxID=3078805 RepID=UPI0029422AA0|nr:twin-arginine translocase subunit TatC [Parvularcula sp. LCG005]WOI52427.1 twin-arginine translocase subunit TatC [Parvularcula sp. LCG005]
MSGTVPAPADDDPTVSDDEVEKSRAPLLSHLTELRQRLIICAAAVAIGFVLCMIFAPRLYNLLTIPFTHAVARHQEGMSAVLNYPPLALFFSYIKLAFAGSLVVAFPIMAWQLYAFVAPGLYKKERSAVLPFLMAIPFLFAIGFVFVHQFILPVVINFALSMEAPAEATGQATYNLFVRVDEYLSLVLTLMVGFGFAMQLPVIMTLLGRVGIINAEFLSKGRPYAVVIGFAIAAILTPPDPFSQFAMAAVMYVLYEVSIVMVRIFGMKPYVEEVEDDI